MQIALGLGLTSVRGAGFEPGATLAMDFTTGRYRVGSGSGASPDFASLPGITVTRASVGYAETSAGALVLFGTGVARITDKGLLIEEARTNLFLNSFAPATQNVTITAVSHTITVWGTGSVTVAAGTATISNGGAVTAGSPRTIGCTVGGTISVTVTGSPTAVQVEAGAFGTSPIPTAGASATRAADSVSIGGITGPSAVSWVAEWLASPNGSARVAAYNNSSDAFGAPQGLIITQSSATTISFGGNGSSANETIPAATPGVTVIRTATMANVSGTAQRVSSQGVAVVGNATLDYTGVGTAKVCLGNISPGATGQLLDSYIRRFVIYPRAFSDAELIAAST